MGITGSIVVYVVVWWLIFFMALPFGVRSQWEEGGEIAGGTDPGAPQVTGLKIKALHTTWIAVGVWAVIWLLVRFDALGIAA